MTIFRAGVIVLAAAACAPSAADTAVDADTAADMEMAAVNTLTDAERQEGWRLLFDGTTTNGWRGYGRTDVPAGWQVVDGTLTRVAEAGDIITTEQFANFELALEWMVGPAGNSGILFRVIENSDPIYYSAPEVQVLDDAAHADGASRLTAAGSNYALHAAPEGVVKPAGEWNAVRLVVNGNHVEHWLNGQKVVEYELGSDDWKQRVAASKFVEWPTYGTAQTGYIGLQDHGDRISFRNIRIRVLP